MTKMINVTLVQASPYKTDKAPQGLYLDGKLYVKSNEKITGKEIINALREFPKKKFITYTNDPHMKYTETEIPDMNFVNSLDELEKLYELKLLY